VQLFDAVPSFVSKPNSQQILLFSENHAPNLKFGAIKAVQYPMLLFSLICLEGTAMLQQDQFPHPIRHSETTDPNRTPLNMLQDAARKQMPSNPSKHWAAKMLTGSVYSWFVLAMIGQWLFALYIAMRYGVPVTSGNYSAVNQGNNIVGYKEGETFYNWVYFSHILPAIVLSISGILQFIPQIRQQFPVIHRWNGRLFLTLGLSGAITGLYLTWIAGNRLSDIGAIGITLNGLLIPIAIALAWRTAVARDFRAHKRWAVHSFLLINGVWSFRLYLFGWFVVNQGPVGNSAKLDGPMDLFFSFACYVLPMLVAELVFWAQRQSSPRKQWLVVAVVWLGFLVTLIGIAAVSFTMWLPTIRG
jgi:uncharacterized membrane protein YhdT